MNKSQYPSDPLSISIVIFTVVLYGCDAGTKPISVHDEDVPTIEYLENDSSHTENENQKWMNAVNQNVDALRQLYTAEAIKINSEGKVINRPTGIVDMFRASGFKVDSITTLKKVVANNDKTYEYEVGAFWTSNNRMYKHLIIWNTKAETKKRALEFIAESTTSENYRQDINGKREKWIVLCNNHNAGELVEQLYTDNALYYNHKPVIIGKELITQEYDYMNNDNYELFLTPIIFERVNETLAFEIGQCSGTYGGKYVLVWQKGNPGEWRILMDSNI